MPEWLVMMAAMGAVITIVACICCMVACKNSADADLDSENPQAAVIVTGTTPTPVTSQYAPTNQNPYQTSPAHSSDLGPARRVGPWHPGHDRAREEMMGAGLLLRGSSPRRSTPDLSAAGQPHRAPAPPQPHTRRRSQSHSSQDLARDAPPAYDDFAPPSYDLVMSEINRVSTS